MFFNLRSDGQMLLEKQEKAAWKSTELVEKMLKMDPYVDYYGGRCIKTDFSNFPKIDLTRYFASCEIALSVKEIISKCFT
jgi:hypothetical protein